MIFISKLIKFIKFHFYVKFEWEDGRNGWNDSICQKSGYKKK